MGGRRSTVADRVLLFVNALAGCSELDADWVWPVCGQQVPGLGVESVLTTDPDLTNFQPSSEHLFFPKSDPKLRSTTNILNKTVVGNTLNPLIQHDRDDNFAVFDQNRFIPAQDSRFLIDIMSETMVN